MLVVTGFAGLTLGGKLIVDGAVAVARNIGMSKTLVGLTAIPARKGKSDIALGNVFGSNIFNIYFVLGVTATVHPLPFRAENTGDLHAMIGANLLLFKELFIGRRMAIGRTEGALLLACHFGYLAEGIARVPGAAGGSNPV